ncbi:MAG: FecR domain-containing protein [Bacteroidota bacterium]
MKKDLIRYNELHSQKGVPSKSNRPASESFVDFLYAHTNPAASEIDEIQAWNKFKRKVESKPSESQNRWLKIAASVTVLLAVAIFAYLADKPVDQIAYTSGDEKLEITFPDGSRGFFNKNSNISFPEKFGLVRDVTFSGEGYFDIEKSSKPFIIKMGQVDVKVLGTAFNLSTEGDQVKLYVDRGLVAFDNEGEETKVAAGTEAIFYKSSRSVEVRKSPTPNVMSWRNGIFEFQSTPLDQVLAELAEYYNVEFKLESSDLKNCHISASFQKKGLGEVLTLLEQILDIKTSRQSQLVKISGKGCN